MLRIFSIAVGIFLILAGIIIFGFFVNSLMKGTYDYDFIKTGFVLIIISSSIISGIYVIINIEKFKNFLLLIASILIVFTIFEIILSTGYFDNLDSDSPIWIPYKYRQLNEMINNKHRLQSSQNEYGFNDINREFNRSSSDLIRIAIMGDSFVWGAAVEDSVIWSHKVQKKFKDKNMSVEVLHWGISGWSSKDEKDFLYNVGYKFGVDMIIIGVVVNDVDAGEFRLREFVHREGTLYKILQKTLLKIFPNSISFLIDYLNTFADNYFGYGYVNWLNKNYNNKNLLIWGKTINEIKNIGQKYNAEILFVLTPENHSIMLGKHFNVLENILKELNAKYINLYPVLKRRLQKYSIRQLWANPADRHPGSKVTDIYAEYTFNYILKNYNFLFGFNKENLSLHK